MTIPEAHAIEPSSTQEESKPISPEWGKNIELNRNGIWVFLSSEVMFFGVLFLGYVVYRISYPEAFAEASSHLEILFGSINTGILLTSSFIMALALNAAQRGMRKPLALFLAVTALLGVVFLGIKAYEYSHAIQDKLFPGAGFQFPGQNEPQAEMFFTLYFVMTGLHALHLFIGILLVSALSILSWMGKFSSERYAPVEVIALYWHFVDIVWIFLFPLLYLVKPG